MSSENGTAIPIDAFPTPVVAYAVCDEEIRLREANEEFKTSFGELSPGAPVSTIFAQFDGVSTPDNREPEEYMQRGESVAISLDSFDQAATYCARIITTEESKGYLIFCPKSEDKKTEHIDVGHVTSVISHDLRNPLDVAKAHLEAARETGNPKHFETVSEAHDRMEQIIGDVLSLAQESEGVDSSEQISIAIVADSAWHAVDTESATLEVTESLPTTTADPNRVQRLFENLFRNAIEHNSVAATDCGQRPSSAPEKITITVGPLENGFYVADDGSGIPIDNGEEIFEPGYSTVHGGTGLGLAIVEKIVAAHGWELELATAEEGGARFEIQFG
jgi:signal transduction histidine kinase